MDWQPIETAPKDGRRVIAVQPSGYVLILHFYDNHAGSAFWRNNAEQEKPYWTPTHWMPLPAAPV